MDIETGKRCRMCLEVKHLSDFSVRTQRGRKYPLSYCKPCKAERERKIRNLNLDSYNSYKRHYYHKNILVIRKKSRVARARNPSYFNERTKKWKDENKNRVSQYRRIYAENNKHKFHFYNSQRRAIKMKAFPRWASEIKIKKIYEKASILGMQVDHIVPLTSKFVCGFHVEENLQLLSKCENLSKGNRSWPDMP